MGCTWPDLTTPSSVIDLGKNLCKVAEEQEQVQMCEEKIDVVMFVNYLLNWSLTLTYSLFHLLLFIFLFHLQMKTTTPTNIKKNL
jgi:hypothetical protein